MQPWFPAVSSKGQRINVFTSVNTLAAVRKRAFTPGNTETQVAENKRVDRRKLPVAQQLPVGDDVSAYNRCAAAWVLCHLMRRHPRRGARIRFLSYFRDEV